MELVKKYNLSKRTWYKDEEVPYPNVSTCLADLSKNYKIGVIANQSLGTANRLEKYGLLKYINLVIASAEEGCEKPDLRIFEIALQRANCKADEAIMVGDRVDNDIIPAKKIGMHTIWMKQGYVQYWPITNENQKADYVVNNIMDVYELLSLKVGGLS